MQAKCKASHTKSNFKVIKAGIIKENSVNVHEIMVHSVHLFKLHLELTTGLSFEAIRLGWRWTQSFPSLPFL